MLSPEVKQQMLFRVSAQVVFEAFVDPGTTTKFWFSHSDGPLEPGAIRLWEWRMYGASTRIEVLDLVPRQRILIEWGESGKRSQVEWNFTARSTHETMVMVRNFGFVGDEASVVSEAIDSMGGFSLMLANAKAWLEHGIDLRLIVDHAPDALVDNWA